jgi:BirA family biotin operon repressor/biotin-[acetyl-CoA-carboxylase] ligase
MFSESLYRQYLRTHRLGLAFVHRDVVTSTMDLARDLAEGGAAHGTLILADEQTLGRGRRGRSFYSPPGNNLYFTLILRVPVELLRRLPLAVPLAVCSACAAEGAEALIKWPNDIWIGDRKISGMLIDTQISDDEAVVFPGIGVNVNADPGLNPELAGIASSLGLELGREVAREPLLARICNGIEEALAMDDATLFATYAAHSMILGRRVTVSPATGDAYEALAQEIAPGGGLIVELAGGERRELQAADVSVRRAAD